MLYYGVYGAVAQLAERIVRIDEVGGSSPPSSIKIPIMLAMSVKSPTFFNKHVTIRILDCHIFCAFWVIRVSYVLRSGVHMLDKWKPP